MGVKKTLMRHRIHLFSKDKKLIKISLLQNLKKVVAPAREISIKDLRCVYYVIKTVWVI